MTGSGTSLSLFLSRSPLHLPLPQPSPPPLHLCIYSSNAPPPLPSIALSPLSRLSAITIFNMVFLVVHVRLAPFYTAGENQWEFFSLSCLVIVSQTLQILSEPFDTDEQVWLTLLIILPLLLLFAYAFKQEVDAMKKELEDRKQAKKREDKLKELEESKSARSRATSGTVNDSRFGKHGQKNTASQGHQEVEGGGMFAQGYWGHDDDGSASDESGYSDGSNENTTAPKQERERRSESERERGREADWAHSPSASSSSSFSPRLASSPNPDPTQSNRDRQVEEKKESDRLNPLPSSSSQPNVRPFNPPSESMSREERRKARKLQRERGVIGRDVHLVNQEASPSNPSPSEPRSMFNMGQDGAHIGKRQPVGPQGTSQTKDGDQQCVVS